MKKINLKSALMALALGLGFATSVSSDDFCDIADAECRSGNYGYCAYVFENCGP